MDFLALILRGSVCRKSLPKKQLNFGVEWLLFLMAAHLRSAWRKFSEEALIVHTLCQKIFGNRLGEECGGFFSWAEGGRGGFGKFKCGW
ncbi:hypothetical protein CEXT_357951 [Caerostris extrusa]|uniref:Uncharacterized protein n=1 Tax=Caerostris extrusa TaxID=172846 RepID=A0AAV4XT49_CAEEX|nr:hypothetical protein CEXT_357951 [Caerostris extrusa]